MSALLMFTAMVQASHNWGGIDVCTVYRDIAPPGIEAASLPEPDGHGARLLNQYCTQCHALTGPGRHTAGEWPAVLERMRLLMDVSRRFRGLMGSIQMPADDELRVLTDYLTTHALQPLRGTPRGAGAEIFANACAACHTLPDPHQYRAAEWPALVSQMASKATVMGREELAQALTSDDLLAYLQRNASDRMVTDPHGNALLAPISSQSERATPKVYGPWRVVWLTPFFVVAGLGAWRWWRRRTRSAGSSRAE